MKTPPEAAKQLHTALSLLSYFDTMLKNERAILSEIMEPDGKDFVVWYRDIRRAILKHIVQSGDTFLKTVTDDG